ncbi:hypothetical protein JHK82_050942 [Glycine max]|nr:hypothetical protein JHK86_050799 [Glycine max]KAG4925089.1 hypothetical protein JHK87_050629 [Glycine soja]KAG4936722.1 hypothetical protein JHK85_051641 [Glycine max]KAG5092164.1 hypothetical protein JHK82_050942 [Glycine max]KAG5095246.1 hypothetical protein JHK84_050834 [Glycine max]
MSELRDDIKMHLDLDRATPTHVEYWEEWNHKAVLEEPQRRVQEAMTSNFEMKIILR